MVSLTFFLAKQLLSVISITLNYVVVTTINIVGSCSLCNRSCHVVVIAI